MPIRNGLIKPLKRNREMNSWFGSPCRTSNYETARVPIIGRMYVHRRVAPAFRAVLGAILEAGKASLIDRSDYGGTYNCRPVRDSDPPAKSPHSWAVAADINVHHALMDGQERKLGHSNFRCPSSQVAPSLIQLALYFNAWGFSWGGHWNSYLDPMHFEATELTVKVLEGGLSAVETTFINRVREQVGLLALDEESSGLKIVLLPGSKVIECQAEIEDGTTRVDLRALAEALGYDVISHVPDQNKVYLRMKGD